MIQSICRGITVAVVAVLAMAAFATLAVAAPPTVVTLPATEVEAHQATVHGTVNPNGVKTAYLFQYGATSSYGLQTKAVPAGNGSATVTVSEALKNLKPGTTYHFRLVAGNAKEEAVYGVDRTFKTAGTPAFEAGAYPASVTGTELGFPHVIETEFGEVTCEEVSLSGGVLSQSSTELSLAPEYDDCEAVGFEASVDMNGCSYVFDVNNTGPSYTGSLTLKCAVGKQMEVTAPFCSLSFPSQQIGTASYGGSGASISVEAEGSGIEYSGSGYICSGSGENGSFVGGFDLSATNEGDGVSLEVGGEPSIGLFLSGEESAEEASQPKLEGEEYPASIVGRPSTLHVFEFEAGGASCEEGVLGGDLSNVTTVFGLTPEYGDCEALGFSATVQMRGCKYNFHVANAGPPYSGTVDLSCGTGQMTITAPFCTIQIPPQTLGAVSYENLGKGNERQVLANFDVEGFEYTYDGVACGGSGSAADGTLEGKTVVEGLH